MKLVEKERSGAKVSKKYDPAKTPYQRLLLSEHISQASKDSLRLEYESIDPVDMLNQLEVLQDQLWAYSWNKNGKAEAHFTENIDTAVDQELDEPDEIQRGSRYYRTSKATDLRKAPRTWRTRKNPFEEVWDEIRLRLELMPETTAKEIIKWLIGKYPNQFTEAQTRTLQRRVCDWRQTQQSLEQRLRTLMLQEKSSLIINTSTKLAVEDILNCNMVFDNPTESLA